ncbi:MAG: hypothetical protein HZB35_05640, partial [Nitrospirae bacterium]|nr:hypothetical protein [Nitrospirota bacterium]
ARQLELHDLATISAKTTGSGEAGAILLKVGQLLMLGGAQISSASALSTLQIPATGRAGTVTIEGLASPADVVAVTDSAILTSAAGTGAGGNITVSSQAVQLTNETISATANAGNAGGVTVQDATAITAVGSRVTTESSTGRGGTISLSASDTISLSNTTVSARVTGGSQAGGNITMAAGQSLIINQGTVISAQSLGTGDAGSITLDAGARYLSADSTVTTEATQASGGNIELTAAELIQLQESAITTSVFGGPNTIGGDIRIDPQFITMRNSRIIAQAVQGQGGNIIIQSGVFLADPNSIVDASSQLGINGSVDIRSPVQNLGAAKRPLSAQYLQGNTLLSQRCAAARSGQLSSFVVLGRDGVPPEPGGYTAGSLTAELARLALESLPPQTTPATQLSRLGFDPTDPFSGLVSLDLFATCKA